MTSTIRNFFFGLLLFVFLLISAKELTYAFIAYSQSTWVIQSFGNFYDSKLSKKEKKLIGEDSCITDELSLFISDDVVKKYNYITDSLWFSKSINVKIKRFRHVIHLIFPKLIGGYDPYLEIIMPKMDYDKCKIVFQSKETRGKIKLTGGQLDHYNTERRSLRIKHNKEILNMDVFNLYHPKVRLGGMYEWLGHELLKKEGLIALKTGYIAVSINDDQKEIYFFQEHPTLNMLYNNNFSPGLIFRLCLRDSLGNITSINDKNNTKLSVRKFYDEKKLKTKIDFRRVPQKI